jgi:uncharacterized protein YceK
MVTLVVVSALVILLAGCWSLNRLTDPPEDPRWWLDGCSPVLDRQELLDLPFSPVVSDEEALRALREIRGLPETERVA